MVLRLDVTDKKASFEAVSKAKKHFGVIDVLINNTGYGHLGAIEELEEQEIRAQFETNVFGLIWLTYAFIPIMREQSSGYIIQISQNAVNGFQGKQDNKKSQISRGRPSL